MTFVLNHFAANPDYKGLALCAGTRVIIGHAREKNMYQSGMFVCQKSNKSRYMRFPTMWYVRPAKPQMSLRISAV